MKNSIWNPIWTKETWTQPIGDKMDILERRNYKDAIKVLMSLRNKIGGNPLPRNDVWMFQKEIDRIMEVWEKSLYPEIENKQENGKKDLKTELKSKEQNYQELFEKAYQDWATEREQFLDLLWQCTLYVPDYSNLYKDVEKILKKNKKFY